MLHFLRLPEKASYLLIQVHFVICRPEALNRIKAAVHLVNLRIEACQGMHIKSAEYLAHQMRIDCFNTVFGNRYSGAL